MTVFRKSILLLFSLGSLLVAGQNFFVDDVASNGNGSFGSPFNNFDDALDAAHPGDTVTVMPGTYVLESGKITTVRSGTEDQRIVIRSFDNNDRPILTKFGQIFEIEDSYITVDGMIMDGQFGDGDIVQIEEDSDFVTIRNCEVRNGVRDGIDINQADNVVIDRCEIHHLLRGSFGNQQDAHGVVATRQQHLTVKNSNIYYVSGDCFQTDPSRALPLWDNVLIENCSLWTGPLPEDAADWNAGEVPGENAIDTKINEDSVDTDYRPKIVVKNVVSYGFEPGFISNRAAFNIKNKVDCYLYGIVTYGSEIAFRLRGPGDEGGAFITMINCIAYDNDKVFRNEDDLEQLHVFNCTFDSGEDGIYMQNTSGGYDEEGFDMRNCLFVGEKPEDAEHESNISAENSFFVDLENRDYHLSPNSPAIDIGDDIPQVIEDLDGNPRVQGSYDVGAYEAASPTLITSSDWTPSEFQLIGNYPNPFNPSTTIQFRTTSSGTVQLAVYDLQGRLVDTLVNAEMAPGIHSRQWDGTSNGVAVASGVYYVVLSYENQSTALPMMLVR